MNHVIFVSTKWRKQATTFQKKSFISHYFVTTPSLAQVSSFQKPCCQTLTGAKCHEHYQATHLDSIFCTNDAWRGQKPSDPTLSNLVCVTFKVQLLWTNLYNIPLTINSTFISGDVNSFVPTPSKSAHARHQKSSRPLESSCPDFSL